METTILIIEDDANTAAHITLYCEREGFKTLAAADGAAGLQNAVKLNPDLIVLDLMLPEMERLYDHSVPSLLRPNALRQ